MNLASLTIRGFRCYGDEPISVRLDLLTTFVGANGSGKTAVLMALLRMFGTTSASRTLTREDFHLKAGDVDPEELSLQIEAHFNFPELLDNEEAKESAAVPECLRHILAKADGSVPIARIRLSAVWRKTSSAEGDIEQRLEWINTVDDEPAEDQVHTLHPWERSLIQVFYVPASRGLWRPPGRRLRDARDHNRRTVESDRGAAAGGDPCGSRRRTNGTATGASTMGTAQSDEATIWLAMPSRCFRLGAASSVSVQLCKDAVSGATAWPASGAIAASGAQSEPSASIATWPSLATQSVAPGSAVTARVKARITTTALALPPMHRMCCTKGAYRVRRPLAMQAAREAIVESRSSRSAPNRPAIGQCSCRWWASETCGCSCSSGVCSSLGSSRFARGVSSSYSPLLNSRSIAS